MADRSSFEAVHFCQRTALKSRAVPGGVDMLVKNFERGVAREMSAAERAAALGATPGDATIGFVQPIHDETVGPVFVVSDVSASVAG